MAPDEASLDPSEPFPLHMCSRAHPQEPTTIFPLREVAGAKDIVHVHVPFSMANLSQTKKKLGSFSTNPTTYIKEFEYLTQSCDLTWHDFYIILSSTLSSEEESGWLLRVRPITSTSKIINS